MSPLHATTDHVLGAVRFLTIVPVRPAPGERTFGAAAFPAVGCAIGLSIAAADALLGVLPFELRNVGVVAFAIVLTGGIHYDGLADTLDALGGSEPAERLRIMRDAAIGTFAVLGLMLALATRISALALLDEPTRFPALVLAPTFGRLAMVLVAWGAAPARTEGLGADFIASLQPRDVAVASGFTLAAASVAGGWFGIGAFLLTAAMVAGVRWLAGRSFGGVTGDVLGAAGEVVETLLLAFFAAGRMGE